MTCRSCGATIADKAIVCYRCGTPTALPPAPVRTPAPAQTPWAIVLAAVMVLVLTVVLAVVSPEHRTMIMVAGAALAAALGAWAVARWAGR